MSLSLYVMNTYGVLLCDWTLGLSGKRAVWAPPFVPVHMQKRTLCRSLASTCQPLTLVWYQNTGTSGVTVSVWYPSCFIYIFLFFIFKNCLIWHYMQLSFDPPYVLLILLFTIFVSVEYLLGGEGGELVELGVFMGNHQYHLAGMGGLVGAGLFFWTLIPWAPLPLTYYYYYYCRDS